MHEELGTRRNSNAFQILTQLLDTIRDPTYNLVGAEEGLRLACVGGLAAGILHPSHATTLEVCFILYFINKRYL